MPANQVNMLSKVKGVITSDLAKVSFLNSVAMLIRMLTGLVSVKVVAGIIGPAGIALLGQLNNFATILQSISNGGMLAGVTKHVSEHSKAPEEYSPYLATSFRITLLLSGITGIVLIAGASYFSSSILHSKEYTGVFYIFGFTIILYSLNTLLIAVINGFKEYKKYVIANILGSIISLIFSVILAIKYNIYGALVAAITFQSVLFFVTLWISRKSKWLKWSVFTGTFSKPAAINLGKYTLMALASAITIPVAQIIIRNFIIGQSSIEDAGLWEGVNRISSMYLMVVTTSLGVYYLPRLAELKTREELRNEIFHVYKLIIPFLLLSCATIYLFRNLIIHLLYTPEFEGMSNLFAFQLLGDFLKMAGWVLGYLLIAKAMMRVYVFMELVNFVLLIATGYFLVKFDGARGATIAYAIVYLVYLLALCIVFRKLLFAKR